MLLPLERQSIEVELHDFGPKIVTLVHNREYRPLASFLSECRDNEYLRTQEIRKFMNLCQNVQKELEKMAEVFEKASLLMSALQNVMKNPGGELIA